MSSQAERNYVTDEVDDIRDKKRKIMASRVLAMDKEGNMSWCSVPEDQRGAGNCPHVSHLVEGQSAQDFMIVAEKSNVQAMHKKVMDAATQDSRDRTAANGRGIYTVPRRVVDDDSYSARTMEAPRKRGINEGFPMPVRNVAIDTDDRFASKIQFNNELNEYGHTRALMTLGIAADMKIRNDLRDNYGVSDPDMQDKAVRIIAMAVDETKGKTLPSGKILGSYGRGASGTEIMMPEASEAVREYLSSYMKGRL